MPGRYTKPVYELEIPWWIYDVLIAAGCLAGFLAAAAWSRVFLAVPAVLLYGSLIEPRLLKVTRYDVGSGERSLRIAFLSDIHVGPYKDRRWVDHVVHRTNALAPDLVLLGGDFLHEDAKDVSELEPLKKLRAARGVFAILGNHDEWKAGNAVHRWFETSGIPLLLNRSIRAGDVAIAGADDDWYADADLEATFRDLPSDGTAIVMLHNPDLAPPAAKLLVARKGPTAFFSGHTHGGQIRLPLLGPVPPLPHRLGRTFDRGLFSFEGIPLVIGAGLGEHGPRARLFCPPEIVLATFRY